MKESWDLVIIGGGPAGLTAGIYGARSGLKTLVIERYMSGGCVLEAYIVRNYPGFPDGVRGEDLAIKMKEQCEKEGAEIHNMETVIDIELLGERKLVTTDIGTYSCDSVIIATGTVHKKLRIPGEEKFHGQGISYCALCDGPLFKDKSLMVVGGGSCAAIDAIYLSNLASSVKLVHRRGSLRAEKALIDDMKRNGIEILYNSVLKEFLGDDILSSVILQNNQTGDSSKMHVDGVFIEIGRSPNTEISKKIGVKLNDEGYIVVDKHQRTNIEGIYAAGDATFSPYKQIGTAVGHAIVAAIEAYGYIKRPYYFEKIQ